MKGLKKLLSGTFINFSLKYSAYSCEKCLAHQKNPSMLVKLDPKNPCSVHGFFLFAGILNGCIPRLDMI